MFISKINIKNFRSYLDEIIEFKKEINLYTLIGANNSGKTNFLDALSLSLGVRNGDFYNYKIIEKDFYNFDTSKNIEIKIYFYEPLEYRDVYQRNCSVEGFVFQAKLVSRGENQGQVNQFLSCFGKNGKGKDECPLMDSNKMYKKPGDDEDLDNVKLPVSASKVIEKIGYVYFLDIQNIKGFFRTSGFSPVGRLFQLYKDDFKKPTSQYKYINTRTGQEKTIESKKAFVKAIKRVIDVLKTDKLNDINSNLSKNITSFLGLNEESMNTTLEPPDYEEIFENILKLKVKDANLDLSIDIEDLGSGYLSLFRMSVLRTLADMKSIPIATYIIEEPEIYLHTHLRRYFYQTLKDLAQKGNQIIISTHSNEFVKLEDYQSLIKVVKQEKFSKLFQIKESLNIDFTKIEQKIVSKNNQEIFFSNYVILVEGQDEKRVFTYFLEEKKSFNPDKVSLSIIECANKDNIPDYIKLCKSLNIKLYVIYDGDTGNPMSAKVTGKIKALLGDDGYFELEPDLEGVLNTLKQNNNWLALIKLLENKNYEEIKNDYPNFVSAIETALNNLLPQN